MPPKPQPAVPKSKSTAPKIPKNKVAPAPPKASKVVEHAPSAKKSKGHQHPHPKDQRKSQKSNSLVLNLNPELRKSRTSKPEKFAFSLPEDDPLPKSKPSLANVGRTGRRVTIQGIQGNERLRLWKQEEAAEVDAAIKEEEAQRELRQKNKCWQKVKEISGQFDVFASAHNIPKHQICIWVAALMIPLSLITITWDLLATKLFEIPHLSTIDAPSFVLFLNFIAMPLAMYGYMMEYLMRENSKMAIVGLICVIVHPILFFIRAVMEWIYDGYRNELKLYFENPETGQAFEYPIGTLDPTTHIMAVKAESHTSFWDRLFTTTDK